jgi:hypothetical protein
VDWDRVATEAASHGARNAYNQALDEGKSNMDAARIQSDTYDKLKAECKRALSSSVRG